MINRYVSRDSHVIRETVFDIDSRVAALPESTRESGADVFGYRDVIRERHIDYPCGLTSCRVLESILSNEVGVARVNPLVMNNPSVSGHVPYEISFGPKAPIFPVNKIRSCVFRRDF